MFIHEYPYSNLHELNLDYIINELNQMDLDIKGIEERATASATEEAKKYVNKEMESIRSEMTNLRSQINQALTSVYDVRDTLNRQYSDYTTFINAQFELLKARVQDVENHIDIAINGCNARTDIVVGQMHDKIMDEISEGLVTEKVINYFTGAVITVQQMFDYICEKFLATGGLTITELLALDKTVNQIVALDKTVSEWILTGGN